MTLFSELLGTLTPDGATFNAVASDDWRQGRTLYGGASAALCLEACLRLVADQAATLAPLRSAQISFIGPAASDLRLQPVIVRQGRSTTFMGCDLLSEGQIATRAVFCFGAARSSPVTRLGARAPDVPGPEACTAFFPQARRPAFAQHFDVRLAAGARPLSGAAEPDLTIWARHGDPNAPDNAVSLLALADVPPPAAFTALSQPAMISTMTWMVDILDATALSAPGWKLMRSTAETIAEGYSAQAMTIWAEDGAAILAGRQTIAVFA